MKRMMPAILPSNRPRDRGNLVSCSKKKGLERLGNGDCCSDIIQSLRPGLYLSIRPHCMLVVFFFCTAPYRMFKERNETASETFPSTDWRHSLMPGSSTSQGSRGETSRAVVPSSSAIGKSRYLGNRQSKIWVKRNPEQIRFSLFPRTVLWFVCTWHVCT